MGWKNARSVALHFNHVACSVALQPTAQLDARSVALHFSHWCAGCTETASALVLWSVSLLSWFCPFRNPPELSARRYSSRRRIFCSSPFPEQGVHRAARHSAASVPLAGAFAAVGAPVCPRSSPPHRQRNLLGFGAWRCDLPEKHTTGGTRPGASVACPCRALVQAAL